MLTSILLGLVMNPASAPMAEGEGQESQPRNVRQRRFQLKDLQTVKLKIDGKHELSSWVMDTNDKRMEGMMFLQESDFTEKQSMLFAFKTPQILGFWMKNTYVPLDIAYLNADGTVNSIYTMRAFDTVTDYSSKSSSVYALEVKAGLWKKLGVKVGSKVAIPNTVKAKD